MKLKKLVVSLCMMLFIAGQEVGAQSPNLQGIQLTATDLIVTDRMGPPGATYPCPLTSRLAEYIIAAFASMPLGGVYGMSNYYPLVKIEPNFHGTIYTAVTISTSTFNHRISFYRNPSTDDVYIVVDKASGTTPPDFGGTLTLLATDLPSAKMKFDWAVGLAIKWVINRSDITNTPDVKLQISAGNTIKIIGAR
jgi:hypothetical protein